MKVIGGLGPELSRIVDGSTSLAIEGEKSVNQIGELIDRSQPALNSQVQTADSIATWVQHMASITEKRAPTVDLCESDELYIPLNDCLNGKGDSYAFRRWNGCSRLVVAVDSAPAARPSRTSST